MPITITLYPNANVFKKGHRIRVDISSSNYPRFDVNPNTGDPLGDYRRMVTGRQHGLPRRGASIAGDPAGDSVLAQTPEDVRPERRVDGQRRAIAARSSAHAFCLAAGVAPLWLPSLRLEAGTPLGVTGSQGLATGTETAWRML